MGANDLEFYTRFSFCNIILLIVKGRFSRVFTIEQEVEHGNGSPSKKTWELLLNTLCIISATISLLQPNGTGNGAHDTLFQAIFLPICCEKNVALGFQLACLIRNNLNEINFTFISLKMSFNFTA